jgi:two-component system, OmpR family, alkaline phosphatase synthesis response regulator PhoP
MAIRIFLVEDEASIRAALKLNLELEGYEVVCTDDGKKVLKMFKGQHFDIILLDIMLPEISGLDLCEQIRLINLDIPIIFLTAKDTTGDKVLGLRKGADDYITKPFNLEELLLRIKILLKRSQNNTSTSIDSFEFGRNSANFKTFEAIGQKGEFKLTKKEAMLLKMLIEHRGEVVSRQQILQNVWGYDVYPSTRTIDNFILSFRKYFEENPKIPNFFHSVRGVGYKFVLEGA